MSETGNTRSVDNSRSPLKGCSHIAAERKLATTAKH